MHTQHILSYDSLLNSYKLPQSMYLASQNLQFFATIQSDGNFVIYKSEVFHYKNAIWSSRTNGKGTPPYYLIMQDDGNLVIYDKEEKAIWSSKTHKMGKKPFCLKIANSGKLNIFDGENVMLWNSN